MIVYLARDIAAFVMYCVNGESGSSLLIDSTDSMIESTDSMIPWGYIYIYIRAVPSSRKLGGQILKKYIKHARFMLPHRIFKMFSCIMLKI